MRLVDDWTWAALTIWMEARGQSLEGKRAVAEVIRNRTRMKYSSDGTVTSTCLRDRQFSCWNSNDPNRLRAARVEGDDPEMRACLEAWKLSADSDRLLPLDTVHYLNPVTVMKLAGKLPSWASDSKKVAVVGDHHFYRA